MIDGVKISFLSNTIETDLNKLGVDIYANVNTLSGEVCKHKKVTYKNLFIKIYATGTVVINGSLHKYWKGENFTDFTFSDLVDCINDLSRVFNFNPSEAHLRNLEFGVNVSPIFNPFDFCRDVIAYKNEGFSRLTTKGGNKLNIGFKIEQQRYALKIYDKGKQYNLDTNILRYEVRANKMEYLKRTGVRYLSDLLDIEKIKNLGAILFQTYSDLIIVEKVNTSAMSSNEERIFALCKNPKEWERFNPKQRCKYKKQFEDIINWNGTTHRKKNVAQLIEHKWAMLLNLRTQKSGNDLTDLILKSGNDLTDLKNTERECFNRSDNQLTNFFEVRENRVCKTCGRDISTQKKGSLFCSETIYGAEAKRCRNLNSNPRNNFMNRERRLYGGVNLNLFEVNQFLK